MWWRSNIAVVVLLVFESKRSSCRERERGGVEWSSLSVCAHWSKLQHTISLKGGGRLSACKFFNVSEEGSHSAAREPFPFSARSAVGRQLVLSQPRRWAEEARPGLYLEIK